ncbi:XdhC family protein [Streptomyces sp. NPDC059009]|uniref:XdhC family protein n=1 Tax=Streptomyces sp. NPDC059009 TaxID=3346694 RepID=UPI00367FC321
MRELAETARKWISEGRSAVLARPVSEQGFGPRHPADALLIGADGTCVGTLYLGAFDAQLVGAAAALAPGHTARVCDVSLHGEAAEGAGMTCGGQAQVLLQSLDTVPARWWDLLAEGSSAALLTRLDAGRSEAASSVVTLAPDGREDEAEGGAGNGAEGGSEDGAEGGPGDGGPGNGGPSVQAAEQARQLLARHRAGRETGPAPGEGLVLVESCPAVPHLVIVGGGELAELLRVQAGILGWQSDVVRRDEDTQRLLTERPRSACLIVLSHEQDLDIPALRTALTRGVPYVGALGSRRTQARRGADLLKSGLTEEQLSPIHGPIGLDIGARTPAETALTICAEVLAALAART